MAGPAHSLRLLLLAACFSPLAHAQTAVPPAPAPAVTEPPASPKLTKLFAGTPPKFEPPKPASATPASVSTTDQPRNGIIRLPTYLVRGDIRVPDKYQILTPKGREAAMAQRYMGPQNNWDHVLNAVTIADLWKTIPILGKFPFITSQSYNERAASIYERPELKRRFNELMSIEQAARELEKPKPAPADSPSK